jgi:hypothetical protein
MSRTVHAVMSIATASQKPYGSRRPAFLPCAEHKDIPHQRTACEAQGEVSGADPIATLALVSPRSPISGFRIR